MPMFSIGDEVALPQGHRAVLRWIGRIPGRGAVEYAGVEVVGPDAQRLGKHSGSYSGQQYFSTRVPGTGLFVSYTQIVSANTKKTRLVPPGTPGAPDSPSTSILAPPSSMTPAYDPLSPSPRYHKPALRSQADSRRSSVIGSPGPASPVAANRPQFLPPLSTAAGSSADAAAALAALREELEEARALRAAERKQAEAQRADYRESLRAVGTKVRALNAAFASRIDELRAEYEAKLRGVRRESQLAHNSTTDLDEERLALAAMQNEILNERAEKQQQIDKLHHELEHVRKLTGSVDDLEALVGDLQRAEQQLAELRNNVAQMDTLKAELSEARTRIAELELGARDAPARREPLASPPPPSHQEVERLEHALETHLLREAELEALNEQLQAELDALRVSPPAAASVPVTPSTSAPNDVNSAATNTKAQKASSNLPRDKSASPLDKSAVANPSELAQPNEKPHYPASAGAEIVLPKTLPAAYDDTMDTSMPVDLAAGREDWCSLCERQGHSAVDCPYE